MTVISGANPIDIEGLIIERLKAVVGPGNPDSTKRLAKFVYDQTEYTAVEEESQLVPSLAVIYNGYRSLGSVGNGSAQAVEFEFLVVVVTSSSRDTLRNTGSKAQASPLFGATLSALTGWKPMRGCKALLLTDAPGAGISKAGFAYTPLAFKTTVTYQPIPD